MTTRQQPIKPVIWGYLGCNLISTAHMGLHMIFRALAGVWVIVRYIYQNVAHSVQASDVFPLYEAWGLLGKGGEG